MAIANNIDKQGLLYLLALKKINNSCDGHKDFYEWNNGTEILAINLIKIGQVSTQPSHNQYELQYWGKDAPIQMDKYPYYGCEVFQCTKCNTLFFYYLELGGHGVQKRYRVIREELINPNSFDTSS